ncbi:MAG: hypothetical protein ABJF10_11575 [Chthoniobacter sp.]|uniref:hypothetical protein n=1 Tax=Chthoniobacter sp. TaxID=2510640 RepID=UPI0032A7D43A
MKTHLFRLTGIFATALLLSLAPAAPAAPEKKPKTKTPATPTDQLEAARTATRKIPALAVDAILKREKFEIRLKVRRVGDDFEMTLAGKQPMTVVRKDGTYFLSEDEGKTWRPTQPDDELVTAVLAPLENGPLVGDPRRATYESLGKEKTPEGVELLHLRLVPNKDDKVDMNDLPQEWLASDGKTGWLVRRSHSFAVLFKQLVNADITYQVLPKDAAIETPVVGAPAKP